MFLVRGGKKLFLGYTEDTQDIYSQDTLTETKHSQDTLTAKEHSQDILTAKECS